MVRVFLLVTIGLCSSDGPRENGRCSGNYLSTMSAPASTTRRAPDALLIIAAVLLLAVGLTWVVPAGSFDRQQVGSRTVVVPGTYHAVDATPVPWWGFFTAPVKGLADHDAAMIIAFVLLIGGAFAVLNATGAIDALLFRVLRLARERPALRRFVIPLLMLAFSIGGKGYLGTGFLHDLYEFDPLGVSCTENLTLELKTDASPAQTTWEIVPQGGGTPYCSGGGYAANTMVYEPCCLPIGYHELRVYDSLGDGIAPGGYRLKNAAGERIIDNWGDGQDFTFTSAAPLAFHVPIGTDKLIVGSCDKETWTANEFIIASPNAGVSAQWGIGNQTDDGYQFWFLNPDGGYSRRIFRDHATSGGFGPANAVRACQRESTY